MCYFVQGYFGKRFTGRMFLQPTSASSAKRIRKDKRSDFFFIKNSFLFLTVIYEKEKKGAFAFGLKIFSSCVTIRKRCRNQWLSRFGIRSNGFEILSENKTTRGKEEHTMKKPILVIMAAGMGSRYGGLKQIDPVDAQGHIIMDFSIYDAKRAGFEEVVFIIKKENEADFRESIGNRMSKIMKVSYVYQELSNLPEGFEVPEGRVKPFGTGHAILSCIDAISGPFAVINADDYYGVHAFQEIYDFLSTHQDDDKYRYTMVAYKVENTLTENGHVARGVCTTDEQKSSGCDP